MPCVLSHPRKISLCWCGLILFWWVCFSPLPLRWFECSNNGSKSQNLLLSSLRVPWGCLTQGSAAFPALGGSGVIFPPFHLPALSTATFHQPDFLRRQRMCDGATNPLPQPPVGRDHGKKRDTKMQETKLRGFFPPNSVGPIYFQFYYMSCWKNGPDCWGTSMISVLVQTGLTGFSGTIDRDWRKCPQRHKTCSLPPEVGLGVLIRTGSYTLNIHYLIKCSVTTRVGWNWTN